MANVKTTLDTRRVKSDGKFNIIFRITHQRKIHTINSGVSLLKSMWNAKTNMISDAHPNSKLINIKLHEKHYKIQHALLLLDDNFTIDRLKKMLCSESEDTTVTFNVFSNKIIQQMMEEGRTGNALVYQTAVNRLITFCGGEITFNKIDYKLLTEFIHLLKVEGLKTNSISNYLRSIRAIYNKAIKHKIVSRDKYPFYDISIKSQRTANRAISKADIKRLNSLLLEDNSPSWRALNYFMLSFYLRGISYTDMAYLKQSNIISGRIHYERRKTHKNYSVKLFTPSDNIINNLHQKDHNYLLPILHNNIIEDSLEAKRIIKQWIKTTNKYLKRLSLEINSKITITTYCSRHSFATIAKHLGYSNELIAEALGHEYGNKITNIYLDTFDNKKLDEMHHKIITL